MYNGTPIVLHFLLGAICYMSSEWDLIFVSLCTLELLFYIQLCCSGQKSFSHGMALFQFHDFIPVNE